MGDVSVGPASSTTTAFNPYKFSAYRNSAFTVSTPSIINFDTKVFDTNGNFDVTTNVGRYTVPVAGFYQINAAFGAGFGGSGVAYAIYLYKNGSSIFTGNQALSPAAENIITTGSWLVQLAAADYIEIYGTAGGAGGITGSGITYFQGFLVSRA